MNKDITEEILTLYEASKHLQVSEKTLAQQAKAGLVPHFRIGKQFRFVREVLMEWAKTGAVPQRPEISEKRGSKG
ncbi:MAG: helix-turn-helix domain-containing protein [Pirellulaceae bacterium]|nr:helix-turn-helix domain-containing protein [Pirellulaceae bacterium]